MPELSIGRFSCSLNRGAPLFDYRGAIVEPDTKDMLAINTLKTVLTVKKARRGGPE
ncbi:hypothetical protein EDF70_12036 [Neorhizobium sp. JUb45]|nr:hypothetical protein EDF70_12036 [Neorhizobium sp. JUb45]